MAVEILPQTCLPAVPSHLQRSDQRLHQPVLLALVPPEPVHGKVGSSPGELPCERLHPNQGKGGI